MKFDFSVKCQVTRIGISDQHRVSHWSFSMVSFAAMLSPNFQSCEVCDYGNKPIDLPFQSWNITEFSSSLLLVLFALRNLLHCIIQSTSC